MTHETVLSVPCSRRFNPLTNPPVPCQIISGGLPPEMCFAPQCEHWGAKRFLKSAGRPENPQIFRPAQVFLSR